MIKVFLLCSGLGRVNRGYESFTRECFEALSKESVLDLMLFKGGGRPDRKQIVLSNLPRNNQHCRRIAKAIGKDSYWVEQVTFALSLLPHLARHKPDVIYFSDNNVGNLLWHWRRRTRQSYKLLLSNSGPHTPPFPRWDHVQQLAPMHLETALSAGQPADTQSLIPYGIHMSTALHTLSLAERDELRRKLELPVNRPILLSVGAVNKYQKRMDYVVREVAALAEPRPFLMMLGPQDEQTPEVKALAEESLGAANFQIRTVPYAEVSGYYQAADIFVLASLLEGFGRVFLESMSSGLPCLAHDYGVTRYILNEAGFLADFEQRGSLSQLIRRALGEGYNVAVRQQRHKSAFERFSWQQLRPHYIEMITRCAES